MFSGPAHLGNTANCIGLLIDSYRFTVNICTLKMEESCREKNSGYKEGRTEKRKRSLHPQEKHIFLAWFISSLFKFTYSEVTLYMGYLSEKFCNTPSVEYHLIEGFHCKVSSYNAYYRPGYSWILLHSSVGCDIYNNLLSLP